MNRLALTLLLGVLVAGSLHTAQANVLDDIKNAFQDAWSTVSDAVTNVATTVECKTVDWAAFTMKYCDAAPDTDLCPQACKDQLNRLPGACVNRLVTDISKAGSANVTTRLESQLTACNITYKVNNGALGQYGSALVPLVVLAASMLMLELLRP